MKLKILSNRLEVYLFLDSHFGTGIAPTGKLHVRAGNQLMGHGGKVIYENNKLWKKL